MKTQVRLKILRQQLAMSVFLTWTCFSLILLVTTACRSDQEYLGHGRNFATTQPSPEIGVQVKQKIPSPPVELWPFEHSELRRNGDSREPEIRYGFLDRKGKICIEPQFTGAHQFSEGLASVAFGSKNDQRWGFIDQRAGLVIPAKYRQAGSFTEGLARVAVEIPVATGAQSQPRNSLRGVYKWGFIDRTGKMTVEPRFTYAWYFSEAFAAVSIGGGKNERWGYIDKQGRLVIKPQFKTAWHFKDGLAAVRVGKLYGYIDKSGAMIIKPQFKLAWCFNNGIAGVRKGGMFFCIDKKGKVVIPSRTGIFQFPREGLVAVSIDQKCGFVDLSGKVVVPLQFWSVSNFHEGLARVGVQNKNLRCNYGYIDRTGKIVIKPQFREAGNFYGGKAHVRLPDSRAKKGEWFLIDGNGTFLEKLSKGNMPWKLPLDMTDR